MDLARRRKDARAAVRHRLPFVTDEQFYSVADQYPQKSAKQLIELVAQTWPRPSQPPGAATSKHYETVQRARDSLLADGTFAPTYEQIASRLGIHPDTLRRWRRDEPAIKALIG
jgi:hypothetical protein